MQRAMWLFDAEQDVVFLRLFMIVVAAIGAVAATWATFQLLTGNA